MRFVGFQVFVFVVELDMPLCGGIMGLVVIFQVIRAQPHSCVLQIDILVGQKEIAFT